MPMQEQIQMLGLKIISLINRKLSPLAVVPVTIAFVTQLLVLVPRSD